MMTVIPTKINANESEIQAALLHHVMQRLARPTFLQREGKLPAFSELFREYLGIHLLGSLKPILDKIREVEAVLEIFFHPTEYDKDTEKLKLFHVVGDFFNAIDQKKTLVCPVKYDVHSGVITKPFLALEWKI